MKYEKGWMPLNRTHVVVGFIVWPGGRRCVEVFESDDPLLIHTMYRGMIESFSCTIEYDNTASFVVEHFQRQPVYPGNSMMFTGEGELYQFEPDHAVIVRKYDSRSEGLR